MSLSLAEGLGGHRLPSVPWVGIIGNGASPVSALGEGVRALALPIEKPTVSEEMHARPRQRSRELEGGKPAAW